MMKKKYFLALGLLLSAFTMQAQTEYVDGILVLNEGNMGASQGSVSYINAGGQVTNNIFQTTNGVNELGDVAQGMVSDGEVTLIMVNNSNKVEIVDAKTFVSLATIDEGVILPRYAVIHEGKAYVTCWGNNDTDAYLAVIDMESYEVENTISLSSGVEKIYEKDNKLYVLHMGGFSSNNIMSVYDIATETIEEMEVSDSPSELVFHNDYAYVLCAPFFGVSTLHQIDLVTLEVEEIVELIDGDYKFIAQYEDTFYIKVSADVYTFDAITLTLSDEPVIETDITTWGGAYGMSIINDKLYLADAKNYVSDGDVLVYSLDGILENTFTVGNVPNNIYASASSATSSEKYGKESIKLYPNPATNLVFLTTENNARIQIFDLLGKELINTIYQSHGIDISILSAGTYLMNIQENNHSQTIRFVKK